MENNKIQTLFDHLPAELLFHIFDYLSCNDVIYAFFYLNKRLKNLLIEHEYSLRFFKLPTKNLTYWQNILPIIESQIRTLKITDIKLSIPLNLFSNLTSLIICSSYDLFNGQLKSIIENNNFKKLKFLKIENKIFFDQLTDDSNENDEQKLFRKVFSNENILQTFEYSSPIIIGRHFYSLSFNPYIQSLTININHLSNGLFIIQYTPNLKYFNIKTKPLYLRNNQYLWPNLKRIKLKKLFLTFYEISSITKPIDYRQLKSIIKQFSLSLICLSFNFVDLNIDSTDDFLFNGIKLEEELLQSMIYLKKFYLYIKLSTKEIDMENILSSFQYDFYFDRQWFFGTHSHYFYSLPFQFDQIYDFDCIKSNNNQLWYNVKSIKLRKIDIDLLKLLKLKMPKLESIKIYEKSIENYENQISVTLDCVTTLHLKDGSIENEKQWLIFALPNLKYLILNNVKLPSSKSELTSILNEKIQRLDVRGSFESAQLISSISICFSNLENLRITFEMLLDARDHLNNSGYLTDLLMLLTNLKTLSFTLVCTLSRLYDVNEELKHVIERVDMNRIGNLYEMKCIDKWIHFSRK